MELIKAMFTGLFTGFSVFCIMYFLDSKPKKKKKKKSKYPKCNCSDVNQCTTYCYAKHAFNKDFQDGKV